MNLGNNNIEAAGATALATALYTNTTLTTLILWYNNIGAAGAIALATALHTNTTLTTLHLRYNNFDAAVATALTTALHTNTTLTTLTFWGTLHPQPVALLPLLQRNRRLWRQHHWSFTYHEDFPVACHTAVITSLLCNGAAVFPVRLPLSIWRTIFSFWTREIFFTKEPVYID
jgi:hypothetical protein